MEIPTVSEDPRFMNDVTSALSRFCHLLVNQETARVVVEPQRRESGFWFGGGNMVQDRHGHLYLVGRYRNAGDSRTGVAAGTRGLELAVFRSTDRGASFQKMVSWDKASLDSPSGKVLSIEGSCLRLTDTGAELFVSTEKADVPYPDRVRDFLKPGAGVWTIDVIRADSIEKLRNAPVMAAFQSSDPQHLHVKDPFFWPTLRGDRLGYCSHPFGWTSSNTGVADLPAPSQRVTNPQHGVFRRGTTWDVAMTRGTCVLPVPSVGRFADVPHRILFYCGGECLRPLDEHTESVRRPRGYSCEELGGAAFYVKDDIASAQRLSDVLPMFISPYGTGCSRYVDVLAAPEGFYATWQQSQPDLSQPQVLNFVPRSEAEDVLSFAS